MKLDVVSILDLKDDLEEIIASAMRLKAGEFRNEFPLKGRTLAMIFEKSSTRTRVSFEAGMAQLGGHALNLVPKELQLGRGETIADTAKVLSRFVDCIMYRAFDHKMVLELAKNATIPVINALDDLEHPCQTVADLMTVKEEKGTFEGLKLAYFGDGNNVCNSLMLGSAMVGMDFVAATPEGYRPDKGLTMTAASLAKEGGSSLEIIEDPMEAAKGADILYTDTWISMGMEEEAKERLAAFHEYQLNAPLVELAEKDCLVMHCLPAHRGEEISGEVMDGPRSVIFDQAENRMHTEKAILLKLIR
jgi:ornithine carbamoyltransferase